MTSRKTIPCTRCGKALSVAAEAHEAHCAICPGTPIDDSTPTTKESLLGPSDHLCNASWVLCPGCRQLTVLRNSDIAALQIQCHSCRKGTPKPLQAAPAWGLPSPRHGEVPPQAPRLRTLVARECCNWNRDGCLFLEGSHCCPPEGKRCKWFEEAVLPSLKPLPSVVEQSYVHWHHLSRTEPDKAARTCSQCGEPIKGRRQLYCPRCITARRRKQSRLRKTQQRV